MSSRTVECEYCGRKFFSRYGKRRFCSRRCYGASMEECGSGNVSLCWKCANTNEMKCSWFCAKMIPVDGWTARRQDTADGVSYFVEECPNFVREVRHND